MRFDCGTKGKGSGGTRLLVLASFVIFLRVFAYQLCSEGIANVLFCFGVLALFLYCCTRRGMFLNQNVRCLVWIVPLIYTMFNCLALGKFTWSFALLAVAIVAVAVLPCGVDWIRPAYYVLILILSVFALATIVLFASPGLYTPIKSAFFAGYHGATGYQSGLTTHYSVNGSFAALGLVLASSVLFFGKKTGKPKVLWAAVTILFFVALLLTAKRGPLLSAGIGILLAYFLSDNKGKFSKFVLVAIVIMCGTLLLVTFVPQVGEVFDRFSVGADDSSSLEETTSGRTNIWALALSDWAKSPVFGIGWGRFVYTYPSGTLSVSLAHNELLHTLATVGIVGSALLVFAEAYSLIYTFKLARGASSASPFRIYLYASFAVQVYTLFYGYTSGGIVQLEYISVPYLVAIAISFSIANYTPRGLEQVERQSV